MNVCVRTQRPQLVRFARPARVRCIYRWSFIYSCHVSTVHAVVSLYEAEHQQATPASLPSATQTPKLPGFFTHTAIQYNGQDEFHWRRRHWRGIVCRREQSRADGGEARRGRPKETSFEEWKGLYESLGELCGGDAVGVAFGYFLAQNHRPSKETGYHTPDRCRTHPVFSAYA